MGFTKGSILVQYCFALQHEAEGVSGNRGMNPHDLAVTKNRIANGGKEIEFLSHALRMKFGILPRHGMAADTFQGLDIARLYQVARYNKLVLLLGDPVLSCLAADIRKPLAEMVERYKVRTVSMNARVISDTISVSTMLGERKIPFCVMKGIGQQKGLYGEYFAKPVGDIDILVPPDQYRHARSVLQSHGFAIAGNCRSLWWRLFLGEQHLIKHANPPVTVDLHYRLQQPGSPSPRITGEFIEQRETVNVAGSDIPVISRAHQPLLSCISIVKALFNRQACGGYACDFFASVKDMKDEETRELMHRAERQGLRGTVQLGFRVASLLFGVRLGAPEPEEAEILAGTADADLTWMVLAPSVDGIKWPHRRHVLRELCDHDVVRFAGEAGWATAADLCRRVFDGGDRGTTSFETAGSAPRT